MRISDLALRLLGATSGEQIIKAAAAASGAITLPAGTTDFSGTGGTSQVVKQTTAGGAFTVGQVAATEVSGLAGLTADALIKGGGAGAGPVASTATVDSAGIMSLTSTGGNPLSLTAAAANNCYIVYTVTAQRTWSSGTAADGRFVIRDVNAPSDRLAIDTSGNATVTGRLGIGIAPSYTLHVRFQTAAGGIASAIHSGPNGADSSTNLLLFGDYTQAVTIGAITRTGTNSVAYGTTSDARLKTVVADSAIGLETLAALRVRDYTMGDSLEQGLVAQEVGEVYPAAVHKGGEDAAKDPWLIDYGRLTPLLVRSVQELAARVAALEAALSARDAPTG